MIENERALILSSRLEESKKLLKNIIRNIMPGRISTVFEKPLPKDLLRSPHIDSNQASVTAAGDGSGVDSLEFSKVSRIIYYTMARTEIVRYLPVSLLINSDPLLMS